MDDNPAAIRSTSPSRDEAAEYYFRYINLVPRGDICTTLEAQRGEASEFFRGLSEEQSRGRYAPDKWSIRQVLGHLNDNERLFAFRAFWFARGFDSPLPSFDQEIAAGHDTAEQRSWDSLIEEFLLIRSSTLELFRHLSAEAWLRRGIASDNPFTVRAIAYLCAGHLTHHVSILREKYL